MPQVSTARVKITTKSPQPGRSGRPVGRTRASVLAVGTERSSSRGGGEVIELECGITVYPARSEGGRWRAVWCEAAERQQCEAATEAKLARKLEKVKVRLEADAPNMRRPGADLIAHYLDPDRLLVKDRWSRKHADTQRRLRTIGSPHEQLQHASCPPLAALDRRVPCRRFRSRCDWLVIEAGLTSHDGKPQAVPSASWILKRRCAALAGLGCGFLPQKTGPLRVCLAAYLSGRAVPLAQSVSWLVRYQGSWWVAYEGGWLRVTDDLVAADIDTCAFQQ